MKLEFLDNLPHVCICQRAAFWYLSSLGCAARHSSSRDVCTASVKHFMAYYVMVIRIHLTVYMAVFGS